MHSENKNKQKNMIVWCGILLVATLSLLLHLMLTACLLCAQPGMASSYRLILCDIFGIFVVFWTSRVSVFRDDAMNRRWL